MKLKSMFWNWTSAIKTFPISHVLLLAISVICICEIEEVINFDSPDIPLGLFLAFIFSCYGPLFLIHSNLKNKNIINRIFQIWSIILGWLYFLRLHNVDLEDYTYSEWLLYLRIIPVALLWIPLIISLFHKKQEEKIRASRTNLFLSLFFWWIASFTFRLWVSGVLASIEALFDLEIYENLYLDIWFVAGFLLTGYFTFNFYLAFTENLNQKSEFKIKPSRLRKIFWSFIFFPLTLIYLIIFLAYWVKILITWVWPKWIIIWLWIWYFSLWIISCYLIYPDKTKTHEIINKIIFISFILIALMMIWAILKRINQYWISINRGFVCYIIAFIIIFSLLSLIFTKRRLLSFILTLSILSLISVYWWPISVNNISFNSQVNRLETLLSKQNLSIPLNEWDLKDINIEDNKLIFWTLEWLVENYNKNKIINKIINYEYEDWYRNAMPEIYEFLWIDRNYLYYQSDYKYRYYEQYTEDESIDISWWFSKLFNFYKYYNDIESTTLKLEINKQEYEFDLSNYIDQLKEKSDTYIENYENKELISSPALVLEDENYKLVITEFGLEEDKESWKPRFYRIGWYILIR